MIAHIQIVAAEQVKNAADTAADTRLEFLEQEKAFDPKQVYGDAPNPTQL